MNEFLAGHLEGIIIFLMIIFLIALSNLLYLRPLTPISFIKLNQFKDNNSPNFTYGLPRISILIPVRNEEKNIEHCLDSLMIQDYPDLEIIVLDDNSTDNTGAILQKYHTIDLNEHKIDDKKLHSLTVLQGEKLPSGWVGKNWACHQLAQRATGDIILFVDADTILNKQAVSTAAGRMIEHNLDLVSFMPWQKMVTWAERLVVPVIMWSVMLFMPLVLAYRLKASFLAMGVGQFIMFNHKTYQTLGGHKTIKNNVVDDIAMVRLFKQNQARWAIFNGTRLLWCRMYSNFAQIWEGFTKNLFGFFGYLLLPYLFIWVWLIIVFLSPLIVIIIALGGSISSALAGNIGDSAILTIGFISGEVIIKATFAIFLSIIIWSMVNLTFHIPYRMTFCYPFSIFLVSLIAFNSAIQYFRGGITWKGRNLEKK